MIRRLHDKNKPLSQILPQCDSDIEEYMNRQYRLRKGRDFRCERRAWWSINGKNYCRLHGGLIALQILLKQEGQDASEI